MKKITFYALMLFSISVWAQNADQIIQNYINAIGGNKLAQVQSIAQKGKMNMNGMDFPMEAYQNTKGQMYSKINMMGSDIIAVAFDGQKGYVFDNATFGYKDIPDSLASAYKEKAQNIFGIFYQYKQKGTTLKYLGKQKQDNNDVEVVQMHLAKPGQDGIQDFTVYFNPETHLITAIEIEKNSHNVLTKPMDYKEVGGITFPFQMKTEVDGNPVMTITFDEIKVNPPAPDPAIFTKPQQ